MSNEVYNPFSNTHKITFSSSSNEQNELNELKKRNEPTKVIYLKLYSNTLLSLCCCPNCYEKFIEPINPLSKQFCGFCGQKLDWGGRK